MSAMVEANDFTSEFYPFVEGGREDPATLDQALLHSVRQKASESISVKERFFRDNAEALVAVAHAVAMVYQEDGRLFTMGNGGSSCDAAHIAVEFTHPVTVGRPALTAVNLVTDTAMMTAVGNDVGFRDIFVRQLIANAKPRDGVIGVSTSGNSENVLAAFETAKKLGLVTIGLTGSDGGHMKKSARLDHCLVVESDSIHRIQECHVAIYHVLWDLVHTLLAHRCSTASTPIAEQRTP